MNEYYLEMKFDANDDWDYEERLYAPHHSKKINFYEEGDLSDDYCELYE